VLAVLWRVPPTLLGEFDEWYDREHIQQRMAVPGFVDARRFAAREDRTRQLCMFDLAGPEVLQSDAYRALGAQPTRWAERIVRLCDVTWRRECSIDWEHCEGRGLARAAAVIWVAELSGGVANAAGRQLSSALSDLTEVPGVLRCRLLHAPSTERALVVADVLGAEAVGQPTFLDAQLKLASVALTRGSPVAAEVFRKTAEFRA
jgi:hypothetical protein